MRPAQSISVTWLPIKTLAPDATFIGLAASSDRRGTKGFDAQRKSAVVPSAEVVLADNTSVRSDISHLSDRVVSRQTVEKYQDFTKRLPEQERVPGARGSGSRQ
jgi:hypothetical protein